MQIIRHCGALKHHVTGLRQRGGHIAIVPTMGALHAGHMALIEAAKAKAAHVIVSIFVNPMQFGPNEDLARYPRQDEADTALLASAGVSALWLPDAQTMYPAGFSTTIKIAKLSDCLCGATRPGHFEGVATVVAKLFAQVRPDIALFGEKDWQQLVIIRRLAIDLDLNVEIIGVPIVRDADGLALSSRNAYLSDDQRSAACALPKALHDAGSAIAAGADITDTVGKARHTLTAAGFAPIDYVAVVDVNTLEPLTIFTKEARILAAARMGSTRLIDNLAIKLK